MTTPAITSALLAPGFADPVAEAQATFRVLLAAIARPGSVLSLPAAPEPPAPMSPGLAALCLTLADLDTRLWLDPALDAGPVRRYLTFHCGSPLTAEPAAATFALVAGPAALPPLDRFDLGSDEQPELSATLLVQVGRLEAGLGRRLTGPGIDGQVRLQVDGLPQAFWQQRRDQQALFPRGLDIVLVAGRQIAALPRTTRIEG